MTSARQTPLILMAGITTGLLLCGCAVVHTQRQGRELDPSRLTQLTRRSTTVADVYTLLGKPTTVQQRSSGRQLFIYPFELRTSHTNPWTLGTIRKKTQTRGQALHLLIEHEVVLDYTLTESTATADEPAPQPAYYPMIVPMVIPSG